ncbi:MAG: peptidoglycan DD-metalloendopeptidase family protein [Alphaproteobacteria bacterium]|nr:peptidoglycan DD-metalloendopeptidase family protein [Alphaproteobacteria bacterium]
MPFPLHAASPDAELKEVEIQLEGASKEQEALEAKASEVSRDLKSSQEALVTLARKLRENERALGRVEKDLARLTAEEAAHKEALEQRQASLAKVMGAMVNLGIVPPEAVLAMPGEAKDTITATAVLETVLKNLETESAALRDEMAAGDKIRAEAELVRAKLADEKKGLEASRDEMKQARQKRESLYSKLHTDVEDKKKEMASLSEKASSLKDLFTRLKRLEDARPVPKPKPGSGKASVAKPEPVITHREGKGFSKAKGSLTPPVMGAIVSRFGSALSAGNAAQGIKIASRENAQVVSPYDGEVVYTGPFLDYGNMLIIRHDKHYHTLIAGVAAIQVSPGQFVLEGEPVGAMGNADSDADGGNPRLYMEIRKDNKPVDPAPWLAQHTEG